MLVHCGGASSLPQKRPKATPGSTCKGGRGGRCQGRTQAPTCQGVSSRNCHIIIYFSDVFVKNILRVKFQLVLNLALRSSGKSLGIVQQFHSSSLTAWASLPREGEAASVLSHSWAQKRGGRTPLWEKQQALWEEVPETEMSQQVWMSLTHRDTVVMREGDQVPPPL